MNVIDVTVLTPSLRERDDLLAECQASVMAQRVQPAAHLFRVGVPGEGGTSWGPGHTAYQLNRMLPYVHAEWVAQLSDDDLWLPHHLEAHARVIADTDADVVYSWAAPGGPECRMNATGIPATEMVERLKVDNYVPGCATIRTSALRAVGGWREGSYAVNEWEDWDLWRRMAAAGSRFACIPEETWVYRLGSWPRTTNTVPA